MSNVLGPLYCWIEIYKPTHRNGLCEWDITSTPVLCIIPLTYASENHKLIHRYTVMHTEFDFKANRTL